MTRKKILKASVIVAVITFILSACMLDSESFIPMIICGVSASWLSFLALVNLL